MSRSRNSTESSNHCSHSGRAESCGVVSDHALVRYIERVLEIDVNDVRRRIFTPKQIAAILALKNCRIPVGKNHVAVAKDGVVVSIVPRDSPKRRTRAKH